MYDSRTRFYLARFLADAFLAGVWSERAMADRAARGLDRRPRWLGTVAREVQAAYHRPPSDRPRELARFVGLVLGEVPPGESSEPVPQVRRWLLPVTEMGRRRWPVPELGCARALGEWLGLDAGELEWMADVRGLERSAADERLRHYRYRTLPRAGGVPRVIERPKVRLKAIQRRILHELLDQIPVHDAAHGFTRGRSAASHASAHVGQGTVVSLDLEDFFASVTVGRVYGVFRAAGYPEPVAHALAGLSTNVVPAHVWRTIPAPDDARRSAVHHRLGRRLATPHLPQGAPTSPALSNLAAFRLDRRLAGLASALRLTYSRYADDLTFSGPARALRDPSVLPAAVTAIVRDEGFVVNQRKFRRVTQGGRQRVCGIVVNQRLNLARAEYDSLKAIIHNAGTRGLPDTDHRTRERWRAHLEGRVAWVQSLHPQRGERLRRELARIEWTA
ncbi:MAG: reverse transcriptase family protein [Solirubrobacteraceae bacterium]